MRVRVHHRGGHYWLEKYTERHATMHLAYVEIADADWRDYWAHVEECREWNDWMRELEGEQYAKDHPDEQVGKTSPRKAIPRFVAGLRKEDDDES